MKNLIRKIFLFSIFTFSAHYMRASDTAVDGIYYNFNQANLTAKVTYKGAEDDWMYDYTGEEQYVGILYVPETVTYEGDTYTVIGFDDNALIGSKLLDMLVIPATVTEFGTGVFTACNSLQAIYIADDNPVFFMYDGVMYRRDPLELFFVPRAVSGSIELYNGITTIPSSAFQYRNITEIIIPESVKTIKDGAFNNCQYLRNLTIGENVTTIERDAFSQCFYLQSVEIPASVESIGPSAFSGCESISSLTLNNGLKTISSYAFSYCYSLSEITLPKTLLSIEEKAFYYCYSLGTVINGSSLDVQAGATTHGYVAYYATNIIDKTLNLEQVKEKKVIDAFGSNGRIVVLNAEMQKIEIYNILGECIYSEVGSSSRIEIPLARKGIYVLKIGSFSKKLLF